MKATTIMRRLLLKTVVYSAGRSEVSVEAYLILSQPELYGTAE